MYSKISIDNRSMESLLRKWLHKKMNIVTGELVARAGDGCIVVKMHDLIIQGKLPIKNLDLDIRPGNRPRSIEISFKLGGIVGILQGFLMNAESIFKQYLPKNLVGGAVRMKGSNKFEIDLEKISLDPSIEIHSIKIGHNIEELLTIFFSLKAQKKTENKKGDKNGKPVFE